VITRLRPHLPAIVALLTLTTTISLCVLFFQAVNHNQKLQNNKNIKLPIPGKDETSDSENLTFTITAEGAAIYEEAPISDARLAQIIAENPGKRARVVARPEAKYDKLRKFLERLNEVGATEITFSIEPE
jgi:biopolymer transport protein ExbD